MHSQRHFFIEIAVLVCQSMWLNLFVKEKMSPISKIIVILDSQKYKVSFPPSVFMNNSFWSGRYPRLSYEKTLSVSNIYFPNINWSKSKTIFIDDNMKNVEYDQNIFESMNVYNTTLIEVEDVYVNVGQFFFHENKGYFYNCICMSYANYLCPGNFTNIVGYYDLIVGFQTAHFQFGHLLLDHFAYLFYIPLDIVQNGYYLYVTDVPYVKEYLSIFGIPSSHIIKAKLDEIYYAKRYYYFNPMQCHSTSPYNNHFLSQFLRKTIGLPADGAYAPWRYSLYTRSNSRIITNLLEFLECFQDLIPENSIVEIFSDFSTRFETGFLYYESLVMFHCHGSAFSNLMFMQKGTLFLEQHMQPTYYLAVHMAYTYGIHSVFTNNNTAILGCSVITLDIPRMHALVRVGLDLLK